MTGFSFFVLLCVFLLAYIMGAHTDSYVNHRRGVMLAAYAAVLFLVTLAVGCSP